MKLYEGNITLEPCHEGLYRLLELNCIQPGAIWLKDTEVVSWPELITKFSFLLVLKLFYFYDLNLTHCVCPICYFTVN
jgi:hypothetical protein